MQKDSNFAKTFQTIPGRFVLPLKPLVINGSRGNIVKLIETNAEAFYLSNGDIIVKPERLCEICCELPRINLAFVGRPYRYFYAICSDIDCDKPGGVSVLPI